MPLQVQTYILNPNRGRGRPLAGNYARNVHHTGSLQLESFSLQHSLRHLCVMHCTVNMQDLTYNSGVFSYSELQLYPCQDMSLRFTGESVATRKVLRQLGKLPGQCSYRARGPRWRSLSVM